MARRKRNPRIPQRHELELGFRPVGHWRGGVTKQEYVRRMQEIDSPLYTHVGGMAAAEATQRDLPLVRAIAADSRTRIVATGSAAFSAPSCGS